MDPETTGSRWPRRALLKTAGLGVLAASGLTSVLSRRPHAWAANERCTVCVNLEFPGYHGPAREV